MNIRRFSHHSLLFVGLATALALIGGCSSGDDSTNAPKEKIETSSFAMTFGGDPNFAGNSVKVCGKRRTAADDKYRCEDGWGATPLCQCFTFPGALNSGSTTSPASLTNLCPSKNLASNTSDTSPSLWDFDITIYNDDQCGSGGGTTMNTEDDDFNFVCYEKSDLSLRNYPNRADGEILNPGKNINDIICVTRNTSKEFNFNVCVDASENGDRSTLDCGCQLDLISNSCECEGSTTPPAGFSFDGSCNLIAN